MLAGVTEMSLFLTNVCNGSKYCPTLLETFGLACKMEILETLACLMLTLNVKNLLPLDALRRQMASAVMPIYEYAMDSRSWLMNG
jgi:hypothetical protein